MAKASKKEPLEVCPKCGGEYIESNIGELEKDERFLTIEISCPRCNVTFNEKWKFVEWEEDKN